MPVDKPSSTPQAVPDKKSAEAARRLMRTALKGSLGTLDFETGHPYASLVLTATEPDGSPVLLISRLARHTRNLNKDSRASLLLDASDGLGDPLAGGRLTLIGEVRPCQSTTALKRFVARHPSAEAYAHFRDFAPYTLAFSSGHFVGGFGKIVTLPQSLLLTDVEGAEALIDSEPDILEHMNADHRDALALYARVLAAAAPAAWRMSGIDPDGIDLLHCTNAARVTFQRRVRSPEEARAALVRLARAAKAGTPNNRRQ